MKPRFHYCAPAWSAEVKDDISPQKLVNHDLVNYDLVKIHSTKSLFFCRLANRRFPKQTFLSARIPLSYNWIAAKQGWLNRIDEKAEAKGLKTLWQSAKFLIVSLLTIDAQLLLINLLYFCIKGYTEPLSSFLSSIFSEETLGSPHRAKRPFFQGGLRLLLPVIVLKKWSWGDVIRL